MKKLGKIVTIFAMLLLGAVLLGACSKKDAAGTVYLLNFKPEIDAQWKEALVQFTAETGIEAKVVTAAGGTYEQTLRSEITKSEPPTLFNINGPIGYLNWKTYTADLKDTNLYGWLSDKSMAISADGGVYGLPYAVETYGIIYNDAIFRAYFALADRAVTTVSSAGQIGNFATLKAVVEDMTARKSELGIDGVFASTSFRPGEDWRWQTHLANLPIYYEYRDKGVGDLDTIDLTYSAQYQNIFDLYINNSVTDRKMIGSKSVDDSMAEFALGKAAMVQNGTWGWGQIAGIAGNVVQASDVKYMPIYTGVNGEEKQGLCTGTENYICLNAKSSKASQEASLKLLEWLFNTPNGKKVAVEKLGFVTPFSTFGADERPDNPLEKEAFRFMSNPDRAAVSWNFTSFPSQAFKDDLGAALYDYALGNKGWNDVSDIFKNRWAEEKALLK
ncbi:MAG: ABC transporter substrate-binding protein [Treponema sp.]|jgi:raffinose/stachyose/melibiose transport system substrate-binding protein|nr:ABC transporter substrate-binding protein [Treponema sp.]